MPSIAQQDYNVIRPVVGTSIESDASAIAELAGHIERGTAFDCILSGRIFKSDISDKLLTRIIEMDVSLNEDDTLQYANINFVRNNAGNPLKGLYINYPSSAYRVFAKIQRQSGADSFVLSIGEDNELIADATGNPVAVNGMYILPQINDDDVIVGWNYGDAIPAGITFYSITEMDADALVGIAI